MTDASLYTNISALNCNPISFSIQGNQFATVENPVVFTNGIRVNMNEALRDCVSFNLNNRTGLFLTDLNLATNFLTDSISPKEIGILTEIESPIVSIPSFKSPLADYNYQIIKLKPVDNLYQMVTSVSKEFNEKDVFKFIFQPDNSVVIEQIETKYLLTSYAEGFDNAAIFFRPRIYPALSSKQVYVDAQRFDYSLGKNTISLFQIRDEYLIPRFQNVVMRLNTGVYGISSMGYLTSSVPFPVEASLNFISYQENPELNSDIKNSFLVKYAVNPLNEQKTLTLDLSTVNSPYSQNYLGIFPFEYAKKTESKVTYPLMIHGLKNYQTPEYNYSFGSEYIQGQKGNRRKYDNIFSGTNQNKGTDNVYLSYMADTVEYNFKPDEETPFYFSPTSNRISLSSCGLIEDGAIAGEIPFTSDRIYIKLQDYSEKIPDNLQPASIKRYSNTWLCSWLSGSMGGDKIWMDRYYNPAYYTIDQALSTKVIKYNDRLDSSLNYTFDVPSEMILEPSVLYRYFHTGRKNRLNFIQYLSSQSILQITNWNSSPLKDESPLQGSGILYFNKPENLKGEYLEFDGSNHVLFPATTNLLTNSKLTISLFINVKNWEKIDGNQIFGNYSNSGFGLINESSLTTPIITLVDNNTNNLYNLNYNFSLLEGLNLKNETLTGNKIIQRLPDYSYWVFDSNSIVGIKYDVNNQILLQTINNNNTTSNLSILTNITQIEIDSNENLYIYDNDTKKYIVLNTYGEYITGGTLDKSVNRIEIDLNNNLVPCFANYSVIDNQNNLWEIVGGNLYKNKSIFGNIGYVQQILVDADNYLWVLNGQDNITKIDGFNKNIIFTRRIGKNSSLPVDACFDYNKKSRFMNFIRVPKDSNTDPCNISDSSTEDRLIIVDLNDNNIYTLNGNGDVLTKLNIIGLTNNINANFLSYGDFTGYTYLRKFTTTKKNFSWKIKIANPNGENGKLLILPFDVSGLTSGWHNFALSFDSVEGKVVSYLDSIKVFEETFDPNIYQIYYDYRTSLLLGCQSIKNTTINDIISIDEGYKFVGQVAELKVYNKSLSQGEIEQLYFSSKYASDDRPLQWNMSVGERNYIEQIKHWYKMQLPTGKSKYYNLNIHNLNVPNNVRDVIEKSIKNNLKKIAPANTSLYKINWK